MDSRRVRRFIPFGAVSLFCLAVLIWIQLWIRLSVRFPPEHVYVDELSPDGGKIARFSVKYQGIRPWLPIDMEPYCYVTIVDARRGAVLLRETEYHGDIKGTFTELARKYAPWAVEQILSLELGSSQ